MAEEEALASCSYKSLLLACPRDGPEHQVILRMFQILTPPECNFWPTRIWASHERSKKAPCKWRVLYTAKNNVTYLQGTQAKHLKKTLEQFTPGNAHIINYEFYEEQSVGQGWLFTWKVRCDHSPNFLKMDNIHTEELSERMIMGRMFTKITPKSEA